MILKVTITSDWHNDDEICRITIKNGNWKYWDWYFESDESVSLTLNNVHKVNLLHTLVKDEYDIHDYEHFKETGEIVIDTTIVRDYDNLLSYLNYRIDNVKKDFKRHGWSEREFLCYSFDEKFVRDEQRTDDRVFEYFDVLSVKIEVVE